MKKMHTNIYENGIAITEYVKVTGVIVLLAIERLVKIVLVTLILELCWEDKIN